MRNSRNPNPNVASGPGSGDPHRGLQFWVQIEGIKIAGFSECTPPAIQTETFEYSEGGLSTYNRRLPVRTKYDNITLKRGLDAGQDLFAWYAKALEGKADRKNMSITVHDPQGQEVCRWDLRDAFPVKWTGPDLKADAGSIAIEAMEIAYHGIIERARRTRPANAPLDSQDVEGDARSFFATVKREVLPETWRSHHVQEKDNSCVIASSRNMIEMLTGRNTPEEQLRKEMEGIIGDPGHDWNTTGTNPTHAQTLLQQHGVPNSASVNQSLDDLKTLTDKGKPVLIGFKNPGHRVLLESVSEDRAGNKTFHVRDPGSAYGGDIRKMSGTDFAAKYNQKAVVIVPD